MAPNVHIVYRTRVGRHLWFILCVFPNFTLIFFISTLFQQADPVPDVWENCKEEVLSKAANDLDPEVGCVIASIDYQSSYIKILKAVSYLNKPDVIFLATNMDERFPYSKDLVLPGTIFKAIEGLGIL